MLPDRAIVVHPSRNSSVKLSAKLTADVGIRRVMQVTSLTSARRAFAAGAGPTIAVIDEGLLGTADEETLACFARDCPDLVLVALSPTPSREGILRMLGLGVHGVLPTDATGKATLRVLSLAWSGFVFVPTGISGTEQDAESASAEAWPVMAHDEDEAFRSEKAARLTPRQRQVLELVTEGHSNKVIANRLGVGESTIKHHVSSILRIMNFGGRSAAAAWHARRDGLAPGGRSTTPKYRELRHDLR